MATGETAPVGLLSGVSLESEFAASKIAETILPGESVMSARMENGLKCIDLFAGAGGFSLGFKNAGFEIAAAIDNSESALETYSDNMSQIPVIKSDLQATSPTELMSRVEYSTEEIDVVIGGPPCKGFSTAGKMDPDDPRNSLVANYINIVSTISPDIVVMENVTGILSMNDGKYKERLITAFRQEGYNIHTDPVVLDAANFGVPQRRERVFFFASKRGSVTPPSPTHYNPSVEPEERPNTASEPWVCLQDAIGDLAFLRYGNMSTEYRMKPLSDYQTEMRKENEDQVYNHKATNHTARVRERFAQLSPGESGEDLPPEYQTRKHSLQRWHHRKPAPTVTTLPDDFIHYSRPRIPTVREVARVQSFPDWFEFKGPRTTGGKRRQNTVPQYSQVGNAVPPKLAEAVATAVENHLETKILA